MEKSNITSQCIKTMKYCPKCRNKLLLKNRENETKFLQCLSCSSPECDYVFYNNPIPVVGAIIEHYLNESSKPKIILVRGKGWPEKWFGLITGFLENGEDPKDAIIREVNEELGIPINNIKNKGLIGIYTFRKLSQIYIIYNLETKGEIKLNQNEICEYKLIEKEKLKPWKWGTGNAVRDWILKSKL